MRRHGIMPNVLQRLAWGPVRLILKLFAGLEVRGLENLKRIRGNMIIASNHANQLDPILIVACFPFFSKHLPLVFGSREKDFYAKSGWRRLIYGGLFFRLMGAHPMYAGLRDYESALRHHLEFARNGKSVCIFPTGKQKIRQEMLRAGGGVGYLAYATNLPILPVRICGLENVTFLSVWTGKHKVTVTFGEPIHSRDIFVNAEFVTLSETQNDYREAATNLMNKIHSLTNER
ncbi:MAG: L-acyl-sn-glycerol-3-phosphate acetyltransferase [Parcubacteria group bacterium GW2011_GWA2_47_7]|nr:MAG: L-acyl-sn-glycerol-3-phosphate acetyltransferase [Parcubacteria group bacterium GW2011_GWA2_47_7]